MRGVGAAGGGVTVVEPFAVVEFARGAAGFGVATTPSGGVFDFATPVAGVGGGRDGEFARGGVTGGPAGGMTGGVLSEFARTGFAEISPEASLWLAARITGTAAIGWIVGCDGPRGARIVSAAESAG